MFKRFAAILSVTALVLISPATGYASDIRDNSSNSMIKNGAMTTDELISKMKSHPQSCSGGRISTTIQQEFQSLLPSSQRSSISEGAIKSSDMRNGTVTKSGNVIIDGKVVATGAHSFGRCDISGSQSVGHLFKRPTSVSFNQEQLSSFVYMPDGKFSYAIIKSCGNLIIATPRRIAIQPAPKPIAQVAPPEVQTVVVTQIQQQAATVQAVPAPVPVPVPVPVQAPAPQPLPKTGAGLASILGLAVLGTTGWYYLRSRKQLAQAMMSTETL